MDKQLFLFLNNLAGKNAYLDGFFIFLAVYLVFILAVIHGIIFFKAKKYSALFWVWAGISLGLLFQKVFGLILFRARPFAMLENVISLIEKNPDSQSFPSGHTIIAFMLAFSISWVNKKARIYFLSLAALVAIGRLLVGVHYISDLLGGLIVAFLLSLVIRKKLNLLL